MEFDVELNFKFDDKEKEQFLVGAIKDAQSGTNASIDSFRTKILTVFPDSGEALEKYLSEDIFNGYIAGAETVSLQAKKVHIAAIAGGEVEDQVTKFMNLIIGLGGKPLTCKATEDEFQFKFSYSRQGISVKGVDLFDD